MNLAEKK